LRVDQIASLVDSSLLLVDQIAVGVLVQDWVGQRTHLKFTSDVVDVELSEEENLRELSVLQVLGLEDSLVILVDDVSILVDEVTLLVDLSTEVVEKAGAILGSEWHDIAIAVFIKDSHDILDVEALSAVIEKSLEVLIVKHLSVKLLSAKLIKDMARRSRQPAVLVDSSVALVDEISLFGLE